MSSPNARIDFDVFCKLAPEALGAMMSVVKAIDESGVLGKDLLELVKLRASQINGCTFCVKHHLMMARKLGVDATKIDLTAVWHDAEVFSERERAALAWTESLTNVATQGASDSLYENLKKNFSEKEIVFLTLAVGGINSWNRLGVGLRFSDPPQG
ncbi:MAG: carboxymuconolactone decarboxylase family protein [Bdellovibrionales bacterium]|jgi:AhpD family alkylhydroperoxidase